MAHKSISVGVDFSNLPDAKTTKQMALKIKASLHCVWQFLIVSRFLGLISFAGYSRYSRYSRGIRGILWIVKFCVKDQVSQIL